MRFIPTRIHGWLDYITGLLLIAAPYLFGFDDGTAAQWVPMVLGAAAIGYSLMTRYELGLAGLISMPTHLWLDGLSGLILASSPWLFGFAQLLWLPHVVLGLFEIAAAFTTKTTPSLPGSARSTDLSEQARHRDM